MKTPPKKTARLSAYCESDTLDGEAKKGECVVWILEWRKAEKLSEGKKIIEAINSANSKQKNILAEVKKNRLEFKWKV